MHGMRIKGGREMIGIKIPDMEEGFVGDQRDPLEYNNG